MNKITFNSDFYYGNDLPPFSQDEIKREPQLWRADSDFAYRNGGEITRVFLHALPKDFQDARLIIDSRVHMLMDGMYPCIPGWHLDDVPRTRPDGQPDHDNPSYKAEHAAAVIGDASRTAFAVGHLTLQDVGLNAGNVYQRWHAEIEKMIEAGVLFKENVDEGKIFRFGWGSFHSGEPATKNGWRMFIRATMNTQLEPRNEIRTQTQVYLTQPFKGW